MPQPENGAADPGAKTEKATESASTAVTPEAETQTANTRSSSLMDRLDIPAEVQQELEKRKPVAEESAEQPETPEAETSTAEAESVEQPETPPESETTEEQPEASGDWPESAKKRVAKLAEQKRKAKEKAEQLEEELEQVKAKLDGIQPVTVTPHSGDLLANVQHESQLAQIEQEARVTKDWCLEHLGTGFVMNEGQENETTISPKEIGQKLALVEDVLSRQLPRKQQALVQQRRDDEIARQHYPEVLDKGSQDYQIAAALMQQIPGLATHPSRNLIIGDFLLGVRTRTAKANGKIKDLPAELQRPIPPIAPPVPTARSNGSTPSPRKKKDEAMNQVIESGGDRESIVRALRETRKADSTVNSLHLVSV